MRKSLFRLLFLISIISNFSVNGQTIINGYANVTAINISKTVLTVNNVNQTNDAFDVGDKIIIMQMQDNVVGSDTLENSSFGNVSAIANAGTYEFATIVSLSPSTGVPTSITLMAPLLSSYNISNQSSVQIVTFKNLGTNFTTTSNITGLAWNGFVGGIIAFQVDSSLTLNHSISANAIGFRGGLRSNNFYNGTSTCLGGPFKSGTITSNAYKGEGIYKITGTTMIAGRGKIANGGGGGGFINCGGAGGGNYTAGGRGGLGWSCTATTTAGGIGGVGLSAFISGFRVFMGGGGGGGQQNDNCGREGGNGGGIIFIKATTISTTTAVAGTKLISSNGANATNSCNDGAGGGGAGGSIIIDAKNYNFVSVSPVTISANGGNGGNCTDAGGHSGGGGGGQGVVLYHNAQPTTNTTSNTINGIAGRDFNNGTTYGNPGSGTNNSAITVISNSPLPIVLLSFEAEFVDENGFVQLKWTTAAQIDNDFFTIESSTDGINWNEILRKEGAGTVHQLINYVDFDKNPTEGLNYYRLKQTDYNGDFTYSKIIALNIHNLLDSKVITFPNPVSDLLNITSAGFSFEESYIMDSKGVIVMQQVNADSSENIQIDFSNLKDGNYLIKLKTKNTIVTKKITVLHR